MAISKITTSILSLLIALLPFSMATSGCTTGFKHESTGQYIDSSAITVKVKSRLLADDTVKSFPISVTTYKNVVQLSGFVDTIAQKHRAVQIARNVPGVVAVTDSLIVKRQ